MSHKQAKQERKTMNEFSKKEGINLKGDLPQASGTYDIVIKVRNSDGMIMGIIGPQGMPPIVLVDVLATAIKEVAMQAIQSMQQKESRIVVPKPRIAL